MSDLICDQVRKEWKKRNNAEYVETISDCELIPDQMYKLSGQPDVFIQPQVLIFILSQLNG